MPVTIFGCDGFTAELHDDPLWLGRDWPGHVLVVASPRHPDGDGKIGEPPLWRSHVDGLEIHGGFDAKPVEVRVEPLSCPVAADVAQPGQEIPVTVELAADSELRPHVSSAAPRSPLPPHPPI